MDEHIILQSDDSIESVMDVDSFDDCYRSLYNSNDNMSKANSQNELPQYSLNDESLMIVEEEVDDSLSTLSSCENIEFYNEPSFTEMTKQKRSICSTFENGSEIENLHQQWPVKKHIASDVDTSKNLNSHTKNDKNHSLNLEKIAIPKLHLSEIKSCHSSQIKKIPPVSVVPNTVAIPKPTTAIKRPQPKLNNTNVSYITKYSKPKHELENNVTSPSKSNSEIYIIPHNGVNYMIKKGECNSRSSKSNNSKLSIVKPIDSKLVEQKQDSTITSKVVQSGGTTISGFLPGIHKYSEGTLKMIPSQEKSPISFKNVFEKNSPCVKQIVTTSPIEIEPKMNDFSNPGKSLTSSNQYAKAKNTSYVQKNDQISPTKYSWNIISKSDKLNNMSKDKKLIPHTITSKDVLENQKNIIIENNEIKIKTSGNQEKYNSSGFLKLTPKSQSSTQPNSHSLSITEYGKIPNNEHIAVQLLSVESPESKTNLNSNNSNDSFFTPAENLIEVFPSENHTSKRMKMTKAVEDYPTNKILLSEEMIGDNESKFYDEDDNDGSGQFVLCNNDYCDTIVHKLELIDDLYCSLDCKNLNSNKMVAVNESCFEFKRNVNPSKTSEIDRKQLLAKLENRIAKRKQSLLSCSGKVTQNNDYVEFPFEQLHSDTAIEENQSPQNSSPGIDNDDVDDDDNNGDDDDNNDDDDDDDVDIYFNLKSYTNDIEIVNYMEKMLIESAPKKLFYNPFPTEKNSFKIGEKLEGIDPEHEALFCVMTVVEVCGYRLKLYFDGFSHDYDFWVNANSPDLFYPKWCKQNMRLLQPPKNYGSNFDWDNYLEEKNADPAPEWKFASTKNLNCFVQHQFCVGAKLEALDKLTRTLPKQLICVATVADILGNRIRIHFDGWTDDFDYWIDVTSTNIHPVGWCEKNGRNLSPPSGYNDFKGKKPFSWKDYLKETNSEPVPEDAFVRRPLRDFTINMKIEVVDLVVPSLIRIASVIDVRGDEIKILYDGFHNKYAYWIEDDSADIHPVGWSLKTNHPIEIPSGEDNSWTCQVYGCNGKGNSNCFKTFHMYLNECPYELDNWKLAVAGMTKIPDRIKINGIQIVNTTSCTSSSKSNNFKYYEAEKKEKCKLNTTENINLQKQTVRNKISSEQWNMQNNESECSTDNLSEFVQQNTKNEKNIDLCENILRTSLSLNVNRLSLPTHNRVWTRHNSFIGIEVFCTTDSRTWSVNDVAAYVDSMMSNIPNINERTSIRNRFIEQEIDGEAFLMLTLNELVDWLHISLGQAVKIASAILMLRDRVPIYDDVESDLKEP